MVAAVVEHHVLQHFDPPGVCLVHQVAVFLVRSQPRVYGVVVRDGISVVGAGGHIVLEQRCGPQGGHAEVGQVVQVGHDARDVAAMPFVRARAACRLEHAFHHVVRRVAVGKTVRHEEVNRVRRVERMPLARRPLPEHIGNAACGAVVMQQDVEALGGSPVQVQVEQQVVRASRPDYAGYPDVTGRQFHRLAGGYAVGV